MGVVRSDTSSTASFIASKTALSDSEVAETYKFATDPFGRVLVVAVSRARRWLHVDSSATRLRIEHSCDIRASTSRADSPLDDVLSVKIEDSAVRLARTEFMMTPVHYGFYQGSFVFATERKHLWALPDCSVSTLRPGQTLIVDGTMAPHTGDARPRERPQIDRAVTAAAAIDRLRPLLLASFERIRGERGAVLFSGGVDSSLVALLARGVLKQMLLVSCSVPNSQDARVAPVTADALGIPITTAELSTDVLWTVLPEVIYAIERWSRMDVEIGLPFFFASRTASKSGYDLVLSGQGPDELFAGYSKHASLLDAKGPEALESELWDSTMRTPETNIERDEKAIGSGGCDAFFPYLDRHFVLSSHSLPATMKIRKGPDKERKWILRRLAIEMGLPEEIALRSKKATQYSSGSSDMLARTVVDNVQVKERPNKKQTGVLIQAVLDRIAAMLGFPVSPSKSATSVRFDTEPTSSFVETLGVPTHHQ